ncbi:uncharacterized protein KY384_006364 [Bacidia gigantensis]|uniref:uncharacterized protein n=1 Tax=Bacidia gigantensis TaxID=2732470 RepID=UPI001D03A38B|nr:uncharacterized protein KY384_006364 [Bacidia gigantensis]KAG8528677.1 hypothetical protein KY384_006364 [Bacidia gigantensis]
MTCARKKDVVEGRSRNKFRKDLRRLDGRNTETPEIALLKIKQHKNRCRKHFEMLLKDAARQISNDLKVELRQFYNKARLTEGDMQLPVATLSQGACRLHQECVAHLVNVEQEKRNQLGERVTQQRIARFGTDRPGRSYGKKGGRSPSVSSHGRSDSGTRESGVQKIAVDDDEGGIPLDTSSERQEEATQTEEMTLPLRFKE